MSFPATPSLSPEEAVLLDAAIEGEERLRACSIRRLTDGRELSRLFDQLSGDIATKIKRQTIAIYIAEELAHAAWTLTTNFFDASKGRCQLALAGVADQTSKAAAFFAYTRMRITVAS